MIEELFNCFEPDSCEVCRRLCHKSGNATLVNNKKDTMVSILKRYGIDAINKKLVEARSIYSIDKQTSVSRQTTRPPSANTLHPASTDYVRGSQLAMSYEWSRETEMKTKTVKEKVLRETRSYEVDEPIYQTEMKYKKETYQDLTYVDKKVAKLQKFERPWTKRINKPMYNTWSHQWEDRWYIENYNDISYQNVYVNEKVPEYVTKERTVPYEDKKIVGYRKVTKHEPIYDMVSRTINEPFEYYRVVKTCYVLVANDVAPCRVCKCPKCDSWYSGIKSFFKKMTCSTDCCSGRSRRDDPTLFYG
jgi:hypothetical protein